jgi:hypothetical protein
MGLPVRKAQLNPSYENDGPELLVQTELITDSFLTFQITHQKVKMFPNMLFLREEHLLSIQKLRNLFLTRQKPAWLRDKDWIT